MDDDHASKKGAIARAVKGIIGGLVVCILSLLLFGLVAVLVDSPIGAYAEYFLEEWIFIPFDYWWPIIASLVGVGAGTWLVLKLVPSASRAFMFGSFAILPILGSAGLGLSLFNGSMMNDVTPLINGVATLLAGYLFILGRNRPDHG